MCTGFKSSYSLSEGGQSENQKPTRKEKAPGPSCSPLHPGSDSVGQAGLLLCSSPALGPSVPGMFCERPSPSSRPPRAGTTVPREPQSLGCCAGPVVPGPRFSPLPSPHPHLLFGSTHPGFKITFGSLLPWDRLSHKNSCIYRALTACSVSGDFITWLIRHNDLLE